MSKGRYWDKRSRTEGKPSLDTLLHTFRDRSLSLLRNTKILNNTVSMGKKVSLNRPGVAQRIPGGLGSQIPRHSARKGGEVVRLTHRPSLPPGLFLVLIFTKGWVDPRTMVRSEGDMSLKNSVTPPAIDPGTVRLVAQRLNHYAIPSPNFTLSESKN
jgi:hypothetical protein